MIVYGEEKKDSFNLVCVQTEDHSARKMERKKETRNQAFNRKRKVQQQQHK